MKISQNVLEHLMLAQVELVIALHTESESIIQEVKDADFYTSTIDSSIFGLTEEIGLANWHGVSYSVLISTEESAGIVSETFRYVKDFVGALIVKNGLVTDGMRFNSCHVEVLEDFTIIYH